MADQVNITQAMLDAIASIVTTQYFKYLAVGEGSTDITLSSADVATPVSISSGVRNLEVADVTVNGNFFKVHFILTSAMPITQPIDIRQLGLHDGEDDTTGLLWGHTLAVDTTKDSSSQWDIWVSGRIVEIERQNL